MRERRERFEPYVPERVGLHRPADVHVREARFPDVGACVRLAGLVADGSPDRWAALFQRDIARHQHHLVVAEHADEVIGYGRSVHYEPEPEPETEVDRETAAPAGFYLMGLVVEPTWRRRGVATALTEARLAWIAQRADEAWFLVDRANPVSVDLHVQAGFELRPGVVWFPGISDGATDHALGHVDLR